jgi:thiol-disulfide isomerase/thioredoxin
MKTINTLGLVLLLAIVGCKEATKEKNNSNLPSASTEIDIDKIQLTDLKNQPIDIKQYKGKTVFVNFWATWCMPCIAEMPSIQKLQARFKDENIQFFLASNEDVNDIEGFKNDNKYIFNYTRLVNMETLNIQAIPTTYIYNTKGKIVFSETGSRNWNDSASIDMITKIINQND